MSSTPVVIGISGASRSGKSTVARQLVELFGGTVTTFSQDQYEIGPVRISGKSTFDHPDCLDHAAILARLEAETGLHRVVIVEGHLLFHDAALLSRLQERVHLDVTSADRNQLQRGGDWWANEDITAEEGKKRRCAKGPHNHNVGFLATAEYFEQALRQWWESPDGYLHRCVEVLEPPPLRFDANNVEEIISGELARQIFQAIRLGAAGSARGREPAEEPDPAAETSAHESVEEPDPA